MRLIDADELKERFISVQKKCEDKPNQISAILHGALEFCIETIDAQPTIEPVKRGKWELDKNRGVICCTNCGGEKPLKYLDNGTFHKQSFLSPYCPHCSAKMDGDD